MGFFRGNAACVLAYFPNLMINAAIKDAVKAAKAPSLQDGRLARLGRNVAAGGVAGVVAMAPVYPFLYVRTRLANDLRG